MNNKHFINLGSFKVVEKFVSINGEGLRIGEPTVFIRLYGCNLRCSYCDTEYSYEKNSEYKEESIDEIVQYVNSSNLRNVTITGGEPLCHKNLPLLVEALKDFNVEVETNGSLDIAPVKIAGASVTVDYKTQSSNMEKFNNLSNYFLMNKNDCVKFVCGSQSDLEKSLSVIKKFNLLKRTNVIFSPIFGMIEPCDIVEFMLKEKLDGAKMQIQIHKIIWDSDKRGV